MKKGERRIRRNGTGKCTVRLKDASSLRTNVLCSSAWSCRTGKRIKSSQSRARRRRRRRRKSKKFTRRVEDMCRSKDRARQIFRGFRLFVCVCHLHVIPGKGGYSSSAKVPFVYSERPQRPQRLSRQSRLRLKDVRSRCYTTTRTFAHSAGCRSH